MASGIIWNGKAVQSKVDVGLQRNLTRAAIFVVRKVKLSMRKGGGVIGKMTKDKKGRFQKMKRAASKPGETPMRQTATLVRSITHEVEYPTARVGSTIKGKNGKRGYAEILEVGNDTIQARPYLRPAVNKNRRQIKKLLSGKII